MAKKTWKKPVSIVMDIGPCKYCKKDMVNTESFVAFMDKTKAHYSCMVEEDKKQQQANHNHHQDLQWSGWLDLNQRSLAPKASALPGYATPRHFKKTSEDYQRISDISTATLSIKSMLFYAHFCQDYLFNL